MYVCRFDDVLAMGDTLLESFENMVEMMDLGPMDEPFQPEDCEFFEQIEVNITTKSTWDIQPQYDF